MRLLMPEVPIIYTAHSDLSWLCCGTVWPTSLLWHGLPTVPRTRAEKDSRMTTIDPAVVPEPNPFVAGELSAQSPYDKCWPLARHLWWTWHPEVINLFRDLGPIRWRQLHDHPIALSRQLPTRHHAPPGAARQADHHPRRYARRSAFCQGLEDARRPRAAVSARLRRGR